MLRSTMKIPCKSLDVGLRSPERQGKYANSYVVTTGRFVPFHLKTPCTLKCFKISDLRTEIFILIKMNGFPSKNRLIMLKAISQNINKILA